MSTLPTVNVTANVVDASGNPVPGALIVFRLNRSAAVGGVIVPVNVTATTGEDGQAVVPLCPNTLCGGAYGVRISADGVPDTRGVAVIPNADCLLDSVFQPVPYPEQSYVETAIAALNNAQPAADEAAASAASALGSSNSAAASVSSIGSSVQDAQDAAVAAQASMNAAANSAVSADSSADSASASASLATTKASEAAASAASVSKGTDPNQLVCAGDLGTGAWIDQTWLYKTAYWDAPSITAGSMASQDVSVPGVEPGDWVGVAANFPLGGNLFLWAEAKSSDVVTIYIRNFNTVSVDLSNATYYVTAIKRVPAR